MEAKIKISKFILITKKTTGGEIISTEYNKKLLSSKFIKERL